MRSTCACLLVALTATWIGLSPRAGAEEDPGGKKQQAKEHFQEGRRHFEAGDFESAALEFEQAYALSPHPAVLINVALSHEQSGRIPEAVAALREYFKNPTSTAQNPELTLRLRELSARIGELTVRCKDVPCEITIDGAPKGTSPIRALVYPGKHRLEATYPLRPTVRMDTEVFAGKKAEIQLELPPPPPAPAQAGPAEPPRPPLTARAGGKRQAQLGLPFWVSVGAGSAFTVSAIVFGALTAADQRDFADSGREDPGIKERGERDRLLCNLSIGLAAASTASALYFGLRHLWSDPAPDRVAWLPVLSPAPGVTARLRF